MLVSDWQNGRQFSAQLFVMPGDCKEKGKKQTMASVYTFVGCVNPIPWRNFYEKPMVEEFAGSHVRVTHRYNHFKEYKTSYYCAPTAMSNPDRVYNANCLKAKEMDYIEVIYEFFPTPQGVGLQVQLASPDVLPGTSSELFVALTPDFESDTIGFFTDSNGIQWQGHQVHLQNDDGRDFGSELRPITAAVASVSEN